MEFRREIEESLIFDNWTADGPAKLVADEVVLLASGVRKPAIGGQGLNAIVFETMSRARHWFRS